MPAVNANSYRLSTWLSATHLLSSHEWSEARQLAYLAAGTGVPDSQGLALLPDTRYYSLDHSQLADEVRPVVPWPPANANAESRRFTFVKIFKCRRHSRTL